jgi:esterase/lipase superfamily enzyme
VTAIRKGMMRWVAPVLAAALAGCAVDDSGPVRSIWRPENAQPSNVNVVYVTDREADPKAAGGYNTRWADKASCGTAQAVIPVALKPGEKPQYGYVAKTTPSECSNGKFALARAVALIEAQAKARNCRSVFLFVHGFHTGFDGAVLRAAQVARDAQTGCAVAAFSWSAEIDVDRYVSDLEHSDYSQPLLAEFLRELAESGLRVTILGHSLGSRLTLMTLSGLAHGREKVRQGFIDELVLAAADIGTDPSNNDFEHLMRDAAPYAKRTTIYVSSLDSVLEISRREHGGVPRLGNATDLGFRPDDTNHVVDVIDASESLADRLDHSYYSMSPETVADMTLVLAGVPVENRLTAKSGWPPTLVCGKQAPCAPQLNVPEGREPRFVTRLIIKLLPFVPLVR